jgi:hypothetical protein
MPSKGPTALFMEGLQVLFTQRGFAATIRLTLWSRKPKID